MTSKSLYSWCWTWAGHMLCFTFYLKFWRTAECLNLQITLNINISQKTNSSNCRIHTVPFGNKTSQWTKIEMIKWLKSISAFAYVWIYSRGKCQPLLETPHCTRLQQILRFFLLQINVTIVQTTKIREKYFFNNFPFYFSKKKKKKPWSNIQANN